MRKFAYVLTSLLGLALAYAFLVPPLLLLLRWGGAVALVPPLLLLLLLLRWGGAVALVPPLLLLLLLLLRLLLLRHSGIVVLINVCVCFYAFCFDIPV